MATGLREQGSAATASGRRNAGFGSQLTGPSSSASRLKQVSGLPALDY